MILYISLLLQMSDTTSKEITFANRQTKVSFKATLYKEEGDLTYTIYR